MNQDLPKTETPATITVHATCPACSLGFTIPVPVDERLAGVAELEGDCKNCKARLRIDVEPQDLETDTPRLAVNEVRVLGPEPAPEIALAPAHAPVSLANGKTQGRRLSEAEINELDRRIDEQNPGILKPPGLTPSRGIFPGVLRSAEDAGNCGSLVVRATIAVQQAVDARGIAMVGAPPRVQCAPLALHCQNRKVIDEILGGVDERARKATQTIPLHGLEICRMCVHYAKGEAASTLIQ